MFTSSKAPRTRTRTRTGFGARRHLTALTLTAAAAGLTGCGGPDEALGEACQMLERSQWVALDRTVDTIDSDNEELVDSLSYVGYQGSHVSSAIGRDTTPYEDVAGPNLDDAFATAWTECGAAVEDFPPVDGPEYTEASEDIQETARQLYEADAS